MLLSWKQKTKLFSFIDKAYLNNLTYNKVYHMYNIKYV